VRGTYLRPKDSNAIVGVRDCATGKALEWANRQTDKQTNFQHIIVRWITTTTWPGERGGMGKAGNCPCP